LILATGSRPQPLPKLPFNGQTILSSSDALTLEEIPGEILVLGGGVIGVEFAFIFNAFGTKVTVVEGPDRLLPLPSVDADSSKILQREMKKKRIPFYPGKTVTRAETAPEGKISLTLGPSPFLETVSEKDKKEIDLQVDKILLTVGRIPNSEHLGLESIGVELDDKGWIIVNSKMETNVEGVYAIGDVLGPSKMMLAHVATMEGLVAVDNCLGGNREMNYQAVPAAIYTFPEVADVGLTETQAQAAGIDYRADKFLLRELGMAHAMGELAGQVKIVSEKKSGRIIGVHMIGAHVTELIAEATLAVQQGTTVRNLAQTIHAHPSLAEGLWETARRAVDHQP
ncbi:MAG: FAD-dependent oxidoreductase, partial [Desulfobacterales bacterium]